MTQRLLSRPWNSCNRKMTTDERHMTVSGLRVAVVRKEIRNLHLGVYPPDGRIRIAAPTATSDGALRAAVATKLGWIKRQQRSFKNQARESAREMVTGESHFVLGKRYRLVLVIEDAPRRVTLRGQRLLLHARPSDGADKRRETLDTWYRELLRELIPPLLDKWQVKLGVRASASGIKKMKTKWGSCNAKQRRIWVNLELAKKPAACLEYLVVHELLHLVARTHSDQFNALMDLHLPRWRQTRALLNASPLAHASWAY
jgi:predicted metal-dependent hydrolase